MLSRDRFISRNRRIILTGLFVGLALVINLAEAQLPPILPGIKPGLANVVSLMALILLGWKEALAVTIMRTTLGSIFSGNLIVMACSITGGLMSTATMILLYQKARKKISLPMISVAGAIAHNTGQLLIVAIIIENIKIYLYLPILLISGVATGYCVGFICNVLYGRLLKIMSEDRSVLAHKKSS